jgi:hypothetical protein
MGGRIESRDDIRVDRSLNELIAELANPVLSGDLTLLRAQATFARIPP